MIRLAIDVLGLTDHASEYMWLYIFTLYYTLYTAHLPLIALLISLHIIYVYIYMSWYSVIFSISVLEYNIYYTCVAVAIYLDCLVRKRFLDLTILPPMNSEPSGRHSYLTTLAVSLANKLSHS